MTTNLGIIEQQLYARAISEVATQLAQGQTPVERIVAEQLLKLNSGIELKPLEQLLTYGEDFPQFAGSVATTR